MTPLIFPFLNTLTASVGSPFPGYELFWADEFSGDRLESTNWVAEEKKRDSAQQTSRAVAVKDGILSVSTFTEKSQHYTGFLTSQNLLEAKYGYIEARIRFQDSPGGWCAFWSQSPTIGKPLGKPAEAGVELDIVEHRAVDKEGKDVRDEAVMNLYWDGYGKEQKTAGAGMKASTSLQGEWHTYGALWTETSYVFYLDGKPTWMTQAAVSRRPQFLRLTCEVKDLRWAGNIPANGYGSLSSTKTKMEVDWVRWWRPYPSRAILSLLK